MTDNKPTFDVSSIRITFKIITVLGPTMVKHNKNKGLANNLYGIALKEDFKM